jgi:hypothetical protein
MTAADHIATVARALCKRRKTGQCAALCLSHSSLFTTGGGCPEIEIVWRQDARAAYLATLKEIRGEKKYHHDLSRMIDALIAEVEGERP